MAPGRRAGAGTGDAGRGDDPGPTGDGAPATIPHSRPLVGDAEAEALRRVVESGMLAQGPRVEELEGTVAALVGAAGGGVALSSGTAALYVGLRCLGVGAMPGTTRRTSRGRGSDRADATDSADATDPTSATDGSDPTGDTDEVLIPAYACTSLAQAVRLAGARPVYVDCRSDVWNADPEDARAKLTGRTRAVIVAHLFGRPADVEPFLELGVPVVEDCAQTLGVDAGGRPVGSRGDLTVCSFYATKLVAGGEGGMLLFREPGGAEVARGMRDCEDYRADDRAFNFKTSDLHAAVALTQLERLPRMLERRRRLARRYREALADLPVVLPPQPEGRGHAWFRFVVDAGERPVEDLLARAEARGLACRRPVGRLPGEVRERLDALPGCRAAWERACSVPLYPGLDDAEVEAVLERFRAAVEEMR